MKTRLVARWHRVSAAVLVLACAGARLGAQTVSPVSQDTAAAAADAAGVVELDPFTIEATREFDAAAAAVETQRAAPNIVSVAGTAEFGPIAESNASEILKYMPGVDVEPIAPGYSRFSVHGFGSENTEILFDGLPLANVHVDRVSRRFDASLVSAGDIAFAEVRKLPLPSDSANSLGGTINLVRRAAFDAPRRRIAWLASLRADAETITAEPLQVPGGESLQRWRPNWQLTWTEPVRPDLGFSVALGQQELLLRQRFSTPSWHLGDDFANDAAEAALAAGEGVPPGVSLYNPALVGAVMLDGPQLQRRLFGSARVDWRPRPGWEVDLSLGMHDSLQRDMLTRFQWTIAPTVNPSTWRGHDSSHTLGQPRFGSTRYAESLSRDQTNQTVSAVLGSKWVRDAWEVEARVGWSQAVSEFADTSEGVFGSTSVGRVTGLTDVPEVGVGTSPPSAVPTTRPIPLMLDVRHNSVGLIDVTAWTTPSGLSSEDARHYTVPADWRSLDAMRIGGARSRPAEAWETLTSAKIHVKRTFALEVPASARLGLDWTQRHRDRRWDYHAWRFVGADGVALTADDSAAQIRGNPGSVRRDPVYGYPEPEPLSLRKLHQLYEDHPDWFRYDAARSERLSLTVEPQHDIRETIAAPYVELATALMERRLKLTGGVRYERTEARARGLMADQSAAYMRYADGSVVQAGDSYTDEFGERHPLVANLGTSSAVNYVLVHGPDRLPTTRAGAAVFAPAIQAAGNEARAAGETVDTGTNLGRGTLAHTRAVYRALGATNSVDQDGWFPSLHANFDLSPQITMQAGYARTQGRLDYESRLVPNNVVSQEPVREGPGIGAIGRVSLRNPDLEPWTADNLEARVSWNLERGLIALGVFRKEVRNFQPEVITPPLTPADIDRYAGRLGDAVLGPEHEGYSLSYFDNAGSARIDGAELELRTPLKAWLPGWADGFTLTGSVTWLDRDGPSSDELGLDREWFGSANLRYLSRRFAVRIGYRYNGVQIVNPELDSNGRPGRLVRNTHQMIDATIEFAIHERVRLFVTGTNLTKERYVSEQRFHGRPAWAEPTHSHSLGTTCAFGVTGTF